MEFTKRSNLGTLLAAVAVGFLALVVNKITPERIDRLVHGMESMAASDSATSESAPIPFANKSIPWLLERLKKSAEFLSQGYKKKLIDPDGLEQGVAELLALYESLSARKLSDAQQAEVESLVFRGMFAAAELDQGRYSAKFIEAAKPLMERQPENSQFHLLFQFHSLHIDQLRQGDLLRRLHDFSQQAADEEREIEVYLLTAKELVRRNRTGDALAVLDQGKETYRDHPSRPKLSHFAIELKSRLIQHR